MTVNEVFSKATEILEKAGIDDPAFEVYILFEDLFGVNRDRVIRNSLAPLKIEDSEKILAAAEKRASGYPLQYIIGNWEFYGRKFLCGEGVLIPRPETELLCDFVLKYYSRARAPKVVDLCSGTGCIAITIAKELSGSDVTAVELYDEAFFYLEHNNMMHGNPVSTVKGDALEPFGMFDCIVSNPPYITENEMKELQTEVTFEPETALFGGVDGLDFYRGIAEKWFEHLTDGGVLAFEIGDTQGEAVRSILEHRGYKNVEIIRDYEHRDRVVIGIKE